MCSSYHCRETPPKKTQNHRSVEYVFRPRDVAMETSRCFPNEHARRQKHIPKHKRKGNTPVMNAVRS